MLKKIIFILLLSNSLFGLDIIIDKTYKLKSMSDMNIVYSKDTSNITVQNIVNGLLRDNKQKTLTDSRRNRMWHDNKDAKFSRLNWNKAKQYCRSLVHGGYDNWYLPSINELETIIEFNESNPAIKEGFVNTASDRYWSSTVSVPKPNAVWIVDFNKGGTSYKSKNRSYHVRCIRKTPPSTRR